MFRDLIHKPGGANKASGEQRFQELMRRHRNKTENSDRAGAEPLPGIKVTRFDLKRVGSHRSSPPGR